MVRLFFICYDDNTIKAKLIVLNSFTVASKSTIVNKYIAEHSIAIALKADRQNGRDNRGRICYYRPFSAILLL